MVHKHYMTIQQFAQEHEFFSSRQRARDAAHGRKIIDLGLMGRGSYGICPRGDRQTVRIYAVCKH
jgi:hypothetical protein